VNDTSLNAGIHAGIIQVVTKLKKVTVVLPEDILARAQKASGAGITPTIRQGLELVAAGRAYDQLRRMRGRVKLTIDLDELRRDRD
jgi:hypothetical protein